ncbi:hypothetical protein HAX54_013830 [Datura stramonium]|uniref:Uncharacterized protein n=1 Tax=Datura stramonium TaxID=4076 RepID=A0ABS8TLY8_DATST|nr:hypothetical protein [Datura stramonium]
MTQLLLFATILPFPFKKGGYLRAAAGRSRGLSKQQSDNIKWQQESFHQILNLMGLCKEGILAESEELLYANCISEEEYHSSKRPLLQRLAVQGAEIETKHVIVGSKKEATDDECSREKWWDCQQRTLFGILIQRGKDSETKSILMAESLPNELKSGKKQWGFDGFKKWKMNDSEDETAHCHLMRNRTSAELTKIPSLLLNLLGRSECQADQESCPNGAPSDFFVDKVLGDSIKKELSRIQTELGAKNSSVEFTDNQIEAISARLQTWCDRYGDVVLDVVRKEFKNHVGEMGGNLKGITREEEKQNSKRWTTFDDYEDDENCHPNLFAPQQDHTFPSKQAKSFTPLKSGGPVYVNSSIDKGLKYNPFFDV